MVLYRLAAGSFYLKTVNVLLRFSLRTAGYSYLTAGNLGGFLCRPLTILCAGLALILGMFLILAETGGLLAAFQAGAYSRKIDSLMILAEGLKMAGDEIKKANWKIFPAAFLNYLLINSIFLIRILSRMKPVNFVMYEILHLPAARLCLILLGTGLVLAAIPSMMLFFSCMIEQKSFRTGMRRSRELMEGKWPEAVCLLLAVNVGLIGILVLLYGIVVAVCALFARFYVQPYASMAVLYAVSMRVESILLFIGAVFAAILDFGVLTVLYFHYQETEGVREADRWQIGTGRGYHIKRKGFLGMTGAMLLLSLFLIYDMEHNGAISDWALGQTEITAHRGSSKKAPENTLAALQEAMDAMADFSEIDVQLSADGQVVVCHDLNLKRVTGVDRPLTALTLEELQTLDAGSFFSPEYRGEKIPALREVLELCKDRMKLNIELKNLGSASGLPEKTAELILEYGMEDQCVVSSVSLDYLKRVREVSPDLRTGYILSAAYGKYYHNEAIDFISIRSSFVTRSMVEAAHEAGKAVHVWTVNSRAEAQQMMLLNVDNIITDYPARTREVLYQEDTARGLMEYIKTVIR